MLFAAVVAHEFERRELPEPSWTRGQRLAYDWVIEGTPSDDDERLRSVTPPWLAARRVYVGEGALPEVG